MTLFKKILLCFALCVAVWLAGLVWFIFQIPDRPADNAQADAIVVLTGGSGRLDYGLELLAQAKGKALFVSGVGEGITVDELLQRASPENRNKLTPANKQQIALGHHAENTIGNAEETSRWLARKHYTSLLLVTGNYHMPRSLEEFQEIMPDIIIVPAPVFPDNFTLSSWWQNDESRELLFSEYHKFLAAELRHWLVSLAHHK